jgi:hypothetical protein
METKDSPFEHHCCKRKREDQATNLREDQDFVDVARTITRTMNAMTPTINRVSSELEPNEKGVNRTNENHVPQDENLAKHTKGDPQIKSKNKSFHRKQEMKAKERP